MALSQKTISDSLDYFRRKRYTERTLAFGGHTYIYFLEPPSKDTAHLSHFVRNFVPEDDVILLAPRPDRTAFFTVAEATPEKFREFALLHEIIEYMTMISFPDSERCWRATQKEIALVLASDLTPDERLDYFEMRIRMFRTLATGDTERKDSFLRSVRLFEAAICSLGSQAVS